MFKFDLTREGSVAKRNEINWRDQDNQGLQNAFIYGTKKEDYDNAGHNIQYNIHTPLYKDKSMYVFM